MTKNNDCGFGERQRLAEEMTTVYPKFYDPEIFKKALGNLLRQRGYHEAPPTKKNELLLREYRKILDKKMSDTHSR